MLLTFYKRHAKRKIKLRKNSSRGEPQQTGNTVSRSFSWGRHKLPYPRVFGSAEMRQALRKCEILFIFWLIS